MAIKVYNTMTRRKEEFVPMTPGKASIYVCGVTPSYRQRPPLCDLGCDPPFPGT